MEIWNERKKKSKKLADTLRTRFISVAGSFNGVLISTELDLLN